MVDLAQVTEKIRAAVGDDAGLGKTVKLDLGDIGKIFIDGASTPNSVTNEDKPADATVSIGWDGQLQLSQAQQTFEWARLGQPRTNVMLVYAAGGDTGWIKNLELLASVVDALPWQDHLVRAVGLSPELGSVEVPAGDCTVP